MNFILRTILDNGTIENLILGNEYSFKPYKDADGEYFGEIENVNDVWVKLNDSFQYFIMLDNGQTFEKLS